MVQIPLAKDKKRGSSALQALLRVTVKNGQPLFTFAVDNERNILAATMKKLSSAREDDYSCIYTFFAIQEIRKKNGGWMNQGGKGKGHDYIPNVVAQLKVSGSQFSRWTRENYMEQSFAREFVLFAMGLQQAETQTLDFHPNDELAAIVVKIPRVINRSTATDGHYTGKCNDFPGRDSILLLGNSLSSMAKALSVPQSFFRVVFIVYQIKEDLHH
ncbi:hypothetical protein GH714_035277 [Hevea brasiliensis]|uniref:Uncharacterized protein n=1 Tax=Hevea brasiliensis TaxID=3981 RepID=A0A6A6KUJ4_HEVBR|nr:hypothetical protein GH714_035277 [Hevea brasiliensis]